MTTDEPPVPTRPNRPADLLTLDLVVTPRWLRERRRVARLVARPEALAAEVARQVAAFTRPDREKTFRELVREQGIKPFNAEEHLRREPRLSHEDWEELRAAIAEGRGR
jgi:hypothetical protein